MSDQASAAAGGNTATASQKDTDARCCDCSTVYTQRPSVFFRKESGFQPQTRAEQGQRSADTRNTAQICVIFKEQ